MTQRKRGRPRVTDYIKEDIVRCRISVKELDRTLSIVANKKLTSKEYKLNMLQAKRAFNKIKRVFDLI